ncbi:MAG TPA: hypothetical protein DEB24_08330 [Coriobacteriia bacterium]|nr:hypothetical protein [Coriobacteriia bacterium]
MNTRVSAVDLVRSIRKRSLEQGGEGVSVAFYHAGLDKIERSEIEHGFREGLYRSIVSTCAFGEGVDIPDISDVLMYHLPYSMVAFNQMAGRAGRGGDKARIHLLFASSDIAINRRILSSGAPSRSDLVMLYRALQGYLGNSDHCIHDFIHEDVCLESIRARYRQNDRDCETDTETIVNSLAILDELGIISSVRVGSEIMLAWKNNMHKVDLASSSRFLEGREEVLLFEQFSKWAFTAQPDSVREYITGPITPTKMKRDNDVR